MDFISEDYRQLNQALHNIKDFGRGGAKHAGMVQALCRFYKTNNVLDYGCGKGQLGKRLTWTIQEYDPAVIEKAFEPEPADIVVCTDVLEHVEPECLDAVLAHLKCLTRIAGYFVISTRYAKKTLSDGRNAHLIVKPASWWRDKLKDFSIVTEIEINDTVEFYVEKNRIG